MYFVIQLIGLSLDLIGVLIVFFYSPENKPDGLLASSEPDAEFIIRNKRMKIGLAIITAGCMSDVRTISAVGQGKKRILFNGAIL